MRLRMGCVPVSSAAIFIGMVCVALAAVSTRGQEATAASGQATASAQPANSGTAAAPSAHGSAKVWTNDDLSSLRSESPVSSVGSGVANTKTNGKPVQPASKARTAYYQNKIARLQEQIPPIDSQISQLQSALSGTSPDAPRKYIGVKLDDWQAELAQLQKKRADIMNQIDSLEDQARHEGVPTNVLPASAGSASH